MSALDKVKRWCADDPLYMGRVCIPSMFSVKSADFHKEITDAYMDKEKGRICIVAPRGHAKSSIAACVWVLHHLFCTPGPHFVVLVSKTEGHAVRLLDTLKNVLEYSLPLRTLFGYHGQVIARSWQRAEIILDTNDMILARGTGQMIVGLKHVNQRPTLMILDDPEDMANTKTVEAMEYNLRWLLQSMVPALDPHRGKAIVIGTPQHQRGMVNILSTTAGWSCFWYDAERDPEKHIALWPEQVSWEFLMKERAQAESIHRLGTYFREWRCRIISEDTQLFKEEHIKWYNGYVTFNDGMPVMNLQRRGPEGNLVLDRTFYVNIFIGIDPATSTDENADYTVIMPVAMDSDRNIYVLPYVRSHLAPSAVIAEIIRQADRWKPLRTSLETSGQQEIYRDVLNNLENVFIPGLTVKHNPRDKKEKRYLEELEPWFNKGKIFLLEGMTELKDELLAFSRDGRHEHDDMIDGLYYAKKRSFPPEKVEVLAQKRAEIEEQTEDWQLS